MNRNKIYKTNEIAKYFSNNRIKWSQLYRSEQLIIDKADIKSDSSILDVGCACGGLGLILRDKYGVNNYTGIEINKKAYNYAKRLYPSGQYFNIDVLNLKNNQTKIGLFDFVFSLSCIDWNVEFNKMLKKIYSYVSEEGKLIISLRLTNKPTISDINNSFQYINYSNRQVGEKASYIVLNANDFLDLIAENLDPQSIFGYGYYGPPSSTAITIYDTICFAVFITSCLYLLISIFFILFKQ